MPACWVRTVFVKAWHEPAYIQLPSTHGNGDGGVWGYSHSVFATGDGIPVGAKIEFFVGTRKDYEAEQGKKNHSGGFSVPLETVMPDA